MHPVTTPRQKKRLTRRPFSPGAENRVNQALRRGHKLEANSIKFNAREIPGVTPQGRLGLFELFSQRDLELIDKANYRWNEEQQALFIDSLINNVPTAPILLLDMILLPAEGHRYSIIDGSERIWSMRRFVKTNSACQQTSVPTATDTPSIHNYATTRCCKNSPCSARALMGTNCRCT